VFITTVILEIRRLPVLCTHVREECCERGVGQKRGGGHQGCALRVHCARVSAARSRRPPSLHCAGAFVPGCRRPGAGVWAPPTSTERRLHDHHRHSVEAPTIGAGEHQVWSEKALEDLERRCFRQIPDFPSVQQTDQGCAPRILPAEIRCLVALLGHTAPQAAKVVAATGVSCLPQTRTFNSYVLARRSERGSGRSLDALGHFQTAASASPEGERCHSGIVGDHFQSSVSPFWRRVVFVA